MAEETNAIPHLSYVFMLKKCFENISSIPIDERYGKQFLEQTQFKQLSEIEAIEKFIANHAQEERFKERIHNYFIPALKAVTTLKNVAKEKPTITSSK